ncbi:AI-2E family transporter [Microbacterium stercoris]|uniref:AI-2E family transporter n=1 Tax=Microbacterium stercoris TaxID=2820289 RepID=A0A939TRC4_9MICO|nr:AI-2E family transporter [Microbacterium stercoris]MBO3664006.1 AI-2E family transporter [Microbacterium stercoris]
MKIHNPFRLALVATLGVGLGILLLQSVQTLSTILLYVGTALFIALGLDPVVSWLERHRFPRWAAVLITLVAVLGLFTGLVLIILPVLVDQISALVKEVSEIVSRGTWLDELRTWLHSLLPALKIDEVLENINGWLNDNIDTISESVLGVTFGVVNGLFGAFIVVILTIYFTASTPSLKRSIYQLAPASKRATFVSLGDQITDSVGYYVMGQMSLAVINGVLSLIFLNIISAPFPAVLAVVAFFGSMIPLVGTISGSAVIVLTCLIPGVGSPTTAVIAAVYYLIYMQIEAYVLSPRIMSRAVSVPGGVVVVAALAGGALLGLLGALIAIPVAASVLIIYRQVVIPRMNQL